MEFKANEVKAGLMILVSLAILVLFLIVIFGVDFGKKTVEYETYLLYVGGIEEGSLVKYGGLDVGFVKHITLPGPHGSKLALSLKIREKTPVRVDSEAYITSIGIMADPHIEISTGSPESPLLPPGSLIKSKEVPSFTQMAAPLGELNEQLQELLSRVVLIFDDQNRSHFASMLANMDNLVANGQDQLVGVMKNLENLSDELAVLTTNVNDLVQGNKQNFDETFSHLEKTTEEISQVMSSVRGTLSNLESTVNANGGSIVQIIQNLDSASQNFAEFTQRLKERPWLLVRKEAPPERDLR